mmetsp:Transcript_4042/g.9971  ORF Transcript_4042/g.9971 Transcript_4042/m.9971 type:complete len:104 (+) Transcript_4042:163-474(+)
MRFRIWSFKDSDDDDNDLLMFRPLSTMTVLTDGGVFDHPIFIKIETVADMTVPVTIATTNVVAVDDDEDDNIVKENNAEAPERVPEWACQFFLVKTFPSQDTA